MSIVICAKSKVIGIAHSWRHERHMARLRAVEAVAEQAVAHLPTRQGSAEKDPITAPEWEYRRRERARGSSSRLRKRPDCWKKHRACQYRTL